MKILISFSYSIHKPENLTYSVGY